MSWKNIKTFLIVLFLIINIYLIFSVNGFDFKKPNTSYVNKKTVSDTINILKNNYNIEINEQTVPESVDNIGIIDVTNIIYTDSFKNSEYDFKTNGAAFEADIETDTYSYNENNSKIQMLNILADIGIAKDFYALDIKKTDEGLVCIASEVLTPYPIFNGEIKAVFLPSKVHITGTWYIAQSKNDLPSKMYDITGVLIDMASTMKKSDAASAKIINIGYGYYVSYYDKNTVSKSSSAIPCYMIETDDGLKYYYDALNGKSLKQEDWYYGKAKISNGNGYGKCKQYD